MKTILKAVVVYRTIFYRDVIDSIYAPVLPVHVGISLIGRVLSPSDGAAVGASVVARLQDGVSSKEPAQYWMTRPSVNGVQTVSNKNRDIRS